MSSNIPENWLCIDCGMNTAPGIPDGPTLRSNLKLNGQVPLSIDAHSEVYMVRETVWKKAGVGPSGGCLCVGWNAASGKPLCPAR